MESAKLKHKLIQKAFALNMDVTHRRTKTIQTTQEDVGVLRIKLNAIRDLVISIVAQTRAGLRVPHFDPTIKTATNELIALRVEVDITN